MPEPAHPPGQSGDDRTQGTYEISVWANPECSDNEAATACEGTGDARAWIGMGSMVIDEVRFTNK